MTFWLPMVSGSCCSTAHACVQVGWTPLHLAARHDREAVADILVGRGADIEAMDLVSNCDDN